MRTARIPLEAGAAGARVWPGWHRLLKAAGSVRLTLVLFGALALGVVLAGREGMAAGAVLALPLGLLALNLACSMATHAAFRTQAPLLAFHLALLAIVVLAATGRLTYLKGQIELSEGQTFEGQPNQVEAGPLHSHAIGRVRFSNLGFEVHYREGVRRAETVNRVGWRDRDGRSHAGIIGDSTPLVIDGYRIYTSFNKGFAPEFTWTAPGGVVAHGTIHLPAYPVHEHAQALEWTPPGAREPLWTMLELPPDVIDPSRPSVLRVPDGHRLVVRAGDRRVELRPGDEADIGGGRLLYNGLRMWMGYTVFHDWTIPWLLAACALAVLALAWHFADRYRANAWWAEPEEGADHGR